jgi:UDP-N-acetylglucosamine 2-epimerase (non-hydrolysing)
MRPSSRWRRPLLVFGTRPEAIKMAPIVRQCRSHPELEPVVCLTAQHRQLLDPVIAYFGIEVDEDLDLMRPHQTLADLTSRCLQGLDAVLARRDPDCVVAQGDTTTVLAAALAAFYRRVPFVHVEAGLRTGDLNAPWPEEMNRRVASLVTALHCAPTRRAADHLVREGIPPDRVHVTGNPVIDALNWTIDRERAHGESWGRTYARLGDRRLVLITGHRRENFGAGFRRICQAIAELARDFPDVIFLYPVHLNPQVQAPVRQLLSGLPNIELTEPAGYPEFVWLMDRATLILTDSGGVQEEAPSLGKPVLVMRDTTERPEAVEAGAVELVGTSRERIVERVRTLLTDETEYARRRIDRNPYGDGHAAERIVNLIATGAFRT